MCVTNDASLCLKTSKHGTIGRVVKDQNCQFILVRGDAFESNLVDRKTVARAMEALK
jgi:hypothetical protein